MSEKAHNGTSQNVLYMLSVALAWSFPDNSVVCICTSSCVGDITFSHNRTYVVYGEAYWKGS